MTIEDCPTSRHWVLPAADQTLAVTVLAPLGPTVTFHMGHPDGSGEPWLTLVSDTDPPLVRRCHLGLYSAAQWQPPPLPPGKHLFAATFAGGGREVVVPVEVSIP